MLNKDYKEMLQCLLEENVKFLLVGAYAVAVHGYPPVPAGLISSGPIQIKKLWLFRFKCG